MKKHYYRLGLVKRILFLPCIILFCTAVLLALFHALMNHWGIGDFVFLFISFAYVYGWLYVFFDAEPTEEEMKELLSRLEHMLDEMH